MLQRSVINRLQPLLRSLTQTRNITLGRTRNLRPSVKIGKDKFELKVDVNQFTLPEIRVKACPDYVVVEGQQERKLKNGYVIRKFVRRFKLPKGCDPLCIESKLSNQGVLTITAQRNQVDKNYPCETSVPIKCTGPEKSEDCFVKTQHNPCEVYLRVQPEKPDTKPPDENK